MIYSRDLKLVDEVLVTFKKSLQLAEVENTSKAFELMKHCAEDFCAIMRTKISNVEIEGLRGVSRDRKTTHTPKDGNRYLYFKHNESEDVAGIKASVKIGIGTLSYQLRFTKSESWMDKDYISHYGNGKILPTIKCELYTKTNQEVAEGKYESWASFKGNLGMMMNQLNRIAPEIDEAKITSDLSTKYFLEYNNSQASYNEKQKALRGMIRDRKSSLLSDTEDIRKELENEFYKMLGEGCKVSDAKEFIDKHNPKLCINNVVGGHKVEESTFSSHTTMLAGIYNIFTEASWIDGENTTIKLLPIKRKNSKNIEVKIADNVKRYNRQAFESALHSATEHIACVTKFNLN